MIRTLGLAALTTALLLPLAPASAETDVYRDARGDVTRVTTDAVNGGVVKTRPDRANRTSDMTRFQTTYGQQSLKLTITLRDLAKRPARGSWSGGGLRIETREATYEVWFSRGRRGIDPNFDRLRSRNDDCTGLTGEVLLARRAYRVTVPADCIGGAAWVRTGAAIGYELVSALPDSWIDYAHSSGWERGGLQDVLGPRVRRG